VLVDRGSDGKIESNELNNVVQGIDFSDSQCSNIESEISSVESEHSSLDIYFYDGQCHQVHRLTRIIQMI